MEETLSGIDKFEIRWQAFNCINVKQKNYIDSTYIFEAEKPKHQPLLDFYYEYQAYEIFPKYFINGKCFTTWWNEDVCNGNGSLDKAGGNINMLLINFINEYYSWFKILIHRLLGNELDLEFMETLNMHESQNIQEIIEEENHDIQLFGCGICADRGCGYFGMQTHRKNQYITWRFYGDEIRDFVFVYDEYEKEFEEFIAINQGREQYRKNDWIKHLLNKKDSALIQLPDDSKWSKDFGITLHELK
ncbi:MAG: hypothetical protein AB8G11_18415 [Saprospiraceae bacterium]